MKIEPKTKEWLYIQLMDVLIKIEDKSIRSAQLQLEGIINKIKYSK